MLIDIVIEGCPKGQNPIERIYQLTTNKIYYNGYLID